METITDKMIAGLLDTVGAQTLADSLPQAAVGGVLGE